MGVRQVADPNPSPGDLHSASIIIETSSRDITITAASQERHEMWFNVRPVFAVDQQLLILCETGDQLPSRSSRCSLSSQAVLINTVWRSVYPATPI